MASIIPGYEYDIFISYRQKDNKYDGWVTDFINNLQSELESTFKDEISVYFDINPHDGLLETHDVDASLKDKLKCLVFIPILSRTYCDPKSFAWEHEFKAFAQQAAKDKFGLKVKLPNGNVAGRILPVRIHDLDSNDIKICESIIGGVLRGVDFIYRSAGVNRPLRSKEDNPNDNLNHTIYRDQINKVSLAVRDIIESMKISAATGTVKEEAGVAEGEKKGKTRTTRDVRSERKSRDKGSFLRHLYKKSILLVPLILLLLALIIIFSSGSTLPFSKRDWVIITDFENQTGEPVFDKSLYTAFTLAINQSSYINVFPKARMTETMKRMKIKDTEFIDDKTGKEIAEREGLKLYIVPGVNEVGKRYVITARIMSTETGDILRSELVYADTRNDILPQLDRLSRKTRRILGESRYAISTHDKPLQKATTSSLEALKLYSLGIEHHVNLDFKGARTYYQNALQIDTGFTAAKASLGSLLIEKFGDMKTGKELLGQALQSINNLTEREKLGILAFYASNVEKDFQKGVEYAKMRVALYPDDAIAHNNLGWYYNNLGNFEDASEEYKTTVRIDPHSTLTYSGLIWIYLDRLGKPDSALLWSKKMISDNPRNVWGYLDLGSAWLCFDSLSRAAEAFIKARDINPDMPINLFRLAHIYRLQKRYNEAIGILKEILAKNPYEVSALYDIGVNFQLMGKREEAVKYFTSFKKSAAEIWLKEQPENVASYTVMSAVTARLEDLELSQQMLQKAMLIDSTQHEKFAEVLCLHGKAPEALIQLEAAFRKGYRDIFWLKLTPDLELLRYDTRFHDLLDKYFK
jgi:tetratricopeptide (TPR) repeat protein